MFSLCIPTMNRFDTFLKKNLEKYLTFSLINEIIITDENGDDVKKINLFFNNTKLRLFINGEKLGPFKNKLKACSLATSEWIALIDSDNFADENYFNIAKKYIDETIKNQKNIILAPSFAKPNFNYKHMETLIFKKGNFNNIRDIDKLHANNNGILMNTGNYIINKFLIDNIDISNETENIKKSPACDVIYFNILLFEQLDLNLHVVPNLEYEHVVHDGSIYIQTNKMFSDFNNSIYKKYESLK
jgi:hypothetical protein